MIRIFLVGYMGVGKTTLGTALAKRLGVSFWDLDHFIQNRYSKSISQLFEEEGEGKFREIEARILKEVAQFEDVVISTGGGTPCFFDNMDIMNRQGITVYLKATPKMLINRLKGSKEVRPLLKEKSKDEVLDFIEKTLETRKLFYEQSQIVCNTECLTTKEDIEKFAAELSEKLGLD